MEGADIGVDRLSETCVVPGGKLSILRTTNWQSGRRVYHWLIYTRYTRRLLQGLPCLVRGWWLVVAVRRRRDQLLPKLLLKPFCLPTSLSGLLRTSYTCLQVFYASIHPGPMRNAGSIQSSDPVLDTTPQLPAPVDTCQSFCRSYQLTQLGRFKCPRIVRFTRRLGSCISP